MENENMTDMIADHIQNIASYAAVWGFILIFVFMTIESSFIPFPSEVVMIPAGFMAYRGELTTGNPWTDVIIAIIVGLLGSLAGAFINYYLAIWLGRPILHKYGKYFFLPENTLNRAEEVFREYGEITTFVCRLLPAIRQLISIPAGLAKMNIKTFTFFTGLGAGIWVVILTFIGWYFGHLSGDMTYKEMVHKGKDIISNNYHWIFIALVVIVAAYIAVHKHIMKSSSQAPAK